MRRGIALETMAFLILAVALLIVLMIVFFQYNQFMYAPIVVFDRISSMIRGRLIDVLLNLIYVFIALFLIFIWTSRMCYNWPVGTATCAALSVTMTTLITYYTLSIAAGIPFIFIGPLQFTLTPEKLNSTLVDYSLDCAAMINYGQGSPLYGTPQNPRICFTINLKPDKEYKIDSSTFSKLDELASYNPLSADSKIVTPSQNAWSTLKVSNKHFFFRVYNDKITIKKQICRSSAGGTTCDLIDCGVTNKPIHDNMVGTMNENCNKVRYYVKVLEPGKRYQVVLGNFKLNREIYNKIYIIYEDQNGNWHEYTDLSKVDITIGTTQNPDRVIYVEFFDDHLNAAFYAPECNNKNLGEGVYICIPKGG